MTSTAPTSRWWPPAPSPAERLAAAGAGAAARSAAVAVRPVLRAGLRSLFGVDEEAADQPPAPGDAGWFGSGSVTWRVHADTSMFVGGIAALALQALHPLAMAGVASHSDFARDPIGRLRRTSDFLGATTFGTSEEAAAACAAVRRIHGRVVGEAPDGRPYAANDPVLLDWVHVTEFGAFAAAQRRYGAVPLRRAELDGYVDEAARVGDELGVLGPPRSWAELADHLEAHRPMLAVGEPAREAMDFLSSPPLPAPVLAVWPVLFRGAMACVPPWATDLWGIRRPSPAERGACRLIVRSLGAFLGPSPAVAAATARAKEHDRLVDAA